MNFDFPVYHNPLKTRADLAQSLEELLAPLSSHAVLSGYHLGTAAALYSPNIARMEAWCRCLWGIAPFIAGGGTWTDTAVLQNMLIRGVNPDDNAYWNGCEDRDQRLVEMAPLSFALILAPHVFWDPLDEHSRRNLYHWLSFIETRKLPDSNWHFFRLIVQTAFRMQGLPVNTEAEEESFAVVESCYKGDGWYEDGKGGYFDLYNPMGFHFYSLVLAALAEQQDTMAAFATAPIQRFVKRFRERAEKFAQSFTQWFYRDGSMIPYGRSLTYRFAESSFFSACAFAGLEVVPWSVMKGIVLRNLRRWFSRSILDSGGILSVGYAYPNLIMADAYNSPGSPYWALKTYLILALREDHPFWRAEEAPAFPETAQGGRHVQHRYVTDKTPGFIISNSAADAQLLCAGDASSFDMNHGAQKYGKFAYSARFGFCVSHSNYGLEKIGCDSMLVLSEGDGYWRERRKAIDREAGEKWLKSRWQPWNGVSIITALVRMGDWHVRIHRIESSRSLLAVEGGFSVPRCNDTDDALPIRNADGEGASSALLLFPWAASWIVALEGGFPDDLAPVSCRRGSVLVPAPNLNVIHPQVAIPTLEGTVEPGITYWACAVWVGDGASSGNGGASKPPRITVCKEDRNRGGGDRYRFVVSDDLDHIAIAMPV
ncbi:MAG: DUF2264 domain-containing protein [Treponema sp.]|jgi:hypothetical protein|nr:DUF2264 domain-containing protein [Treponema sp.]